MTPEQVILEVCVEDLYNQIEEAEKEV